MAFKFINNCNQAGRTFARCAYLAFAFAICVSGCKNDQTGQSVPRITILCAASAGDVVKELAQKYESAFNVKVNVSSASSNSCAHQILSGAPADLFVSANWMWIAELEEANLVLDKTNLAANSLVLVVPASNPASVNSLADLVDEQVKFVALAGERVPAGEYADSVLVKAGILKSLEDQRKIVRAKDVRTALAFVECREADAGIVYSTDAKSSDRVQVVADLLPAKLSRIDTGQNSNAEVNSIVYGVAKLRTDRKRGIIVDGFYDYLVSSEAQELFEEHGFVPITPSATTSVSD